jgi:hypothetical protein
VHAHDEVIAVHRRHLAVQPIPERAAQCGVRVQLGIGLDMAEQPDAGPEQPGGERRAVAGVDALRVLAKEIEIKAEVEHPEILLVVARPEQVGTQARAAPDHLPELDLRVDGLEENEVRHLRNVDAGVEHVHRDGNVRSLVLLREIVDQALGILRRKMLPIARFW